MQFLEQNKKVDTNKFSLFLFITFFTQRFFDKLSRHNEVQLR